MYDATPIQCIAHGFVPFADVDGLITNAVVEGVAAVNRLSIGHTQIILDLGLAGGGTIAIQDLRPTIVPTPNAGLFPIAFDMASSQLPTGATQLLVQMWNATTGVLVDNAYFFIIQRPGASET
jgi:hypothetical protein